LIKKEDKMPKEEGIDDTSIEDEHAVKNRSWIPMELIFQNY